MIESIDGYLENPRNDEGIYVHVHIIWNRVTHHNSWWTAKLLIYNF